MTYATSIASRSQSIRVLVKIAGVPGYLTDFDADTYDDSAGGNTHGSQACYPHIISASYSAGSLDHQRHRVTQSTLSLEVQDSAWLRGLLARRASTAYLDAPVSAADADITHTDPCDGSAVFSVGNQYAHVGRETIYVGSDYVSAGLFESTTRGALGTTAEPHPEGTAISTTPRHWIGRKAWLVLGSNDGSGWAYEDPFQTFRISASPRYVDGVWVFEFSDSMDFTDRNFYVGFRDVTVSDFMIAADASNDVVAYLYVDDVAHFLESGGPTKQPLSVILGAGSGPGCFGVDDVDVDNDRLVINLSSRNLFKKRQRMRNWIGETFGEDQTNVMHRNVRHPLAGVTARPAYYIRDAADVPLRVMLSTYGAAGDNYDLLPGAAATKDEIEIRAGAGLTSADVDVATWTGAGEFAMPAAGYLVGAAGPISVAEFLSSDVCPVIGGYWRVSRAGKIQFKSYNPTTSATSSSYSVTSATTLGGSVNYADDEIAIVSRVILWTEYDPESGDFRKKIVAHYGEQDHIYGKTAQEYEVKSRLAAVSGQSALGVAERYFARFGTGVMRIGVTCPWSACTVQPGDTVAVTSAYLPQPTSSTLGQTAQLYEVASATLDLERCTVRMELVSRPSARLISPAALVSSVSGSDAECTLAYGNGDLDAEFAIGWYVQAISSAGALRAGTAEITDLDSDTITLGAGITGLADGDTIIFADYGTAVDTAVATYSGANQTGFAFISDQAIDAAQAGDRWY